MSSVDLPIKRKRSSSLDDSESDEEQSEIVTKKANKYTNKQRILIIASRGIIARYRHLMMNFKALLPQAKMDVKLDIRKGIAALNEISEMKGCNSCLFFETKKKQDLCLWMSKTPNGPSVKFLVSNVHTMEELKLTGNCLMGSRPLLIFDETFETKPHYKLLREMLNQIFAVPCNHPKSKPFIDHAFCFYIMDHRIWFRNYQIIDNASTESEIKKKLKAGHGTTELIEIGPRMVLDVIRIFKGSFGGQTLYKNPVYFDE